MELAPWIGDAAPVMTALQERLADGSAAPLSASERAVVVELLRRLLAAELQHPETAVLPEARLVENLGADSLTFVEIFAELSEVFHLELDAHRTGRFFVGRGLTTVGDLAAAIIEILEAGGRIPELAGS